MTYNGVDTAGRISADKAKTLRENGMSFIARYLVPETMWKALTKQEASGIRNAGLALMLCWELGSDDIKLGAVKGAEHGKTARQLAEAMGVPTGTIIYFAADYNVPESDYNAIEQYMISAQTAFAGKYRAGLYGHERIVKHLAERGSVKYFWQCVAWSNAFDPAATVRQYAHQGDSRAKAVAAKIGIDVDLDATETLDGMWMPSVASYDDGEGGTIIDYTGGTQTATPWYAEAMAWAKERHIINDGRPNDPVTRAELATVLYRIIGPEDEKSVSGMLTDE